MRSEQQQKKISEIYSDDSRFRDLTMYVSRSVAVKMRWAGSNCWLKQFKLRNKTFWECFESKEVIIRWFQSVANCLELDKYNMRYYILDI